MNRLEKALLDDTNLQLDLYLEDEKTANIRAHIEEMVKNSAVSTEGGVIKQKLIEFIESLA